MYKLLLTVLFTIAAQNALAFTGGIEVVKLTEMIKLMQVEVDTLNESLSEMKDLTDLQQQLSEMQQQELIKEISETGEALSSLTTSLQNTSQLTQDIYGNVVGVDQQISTVLSDIYNYGEGFTGYFQLSSKSGFGKVDEVLADLNQVSSHLGRLDNQYWTGTYQSEFLPDNYNAAGVNEVVGRSTAIADDLSATSGIDLALQDASTRISEEGLSEGDAQRLTAEQLNLLGLLIARQSYRSIADDSQELELQAAKERQVEEEKAYYRAMFLNPYLIEGDD